ncbi:circadian clock protein KaiC [Pseudomonas sp. CDFA 602]|uniref:circadian clock protein KaiC n=1 Tax=Pseudomonas californiensis TaxID=2829823 RepID=UPI001E429A51|nr:circadian clock protein KaiC [Pseudomonas californiensis]MCD5996166.1 circadian clock protein KaiC [Pseudomonas californiensis]MCD6001786.1 circadian clock protein KaiC [Pseudomonas californiensis]
MSHAIQLQKAPTGINGLDDILLGGLPEGRPSLVCGSAGCGKTLFGMTFLVKGVMEYGETGVFMSFEERAGDLVQNVGSLGFDLQRLVDEQKIVIDHVHVDRSEIEEAGDYDLEGLFVRLGYAIDTVGAKRVVLDTIEALFSSFKDTAILRSELRRLFYWLKDRGVTTIITGERGDGSLTRYGIEEYVSDCVILLDNRVVEQITTRRLRVVKYRGSSHGTNEYPFFIDEHGISVLPITAAGLNHQASMRIVPTGIRGLDAMLSKGGYYQGSSVLVSGLAGTGKTTFAASFVDACCSRGERCLFFSFEEAENQLMRNMESVGINLSKYRDSGLLKVESARPSLYGLEVHLARMHREIELFQPDAVVIDPISAFRGPDSEVHAILLRLIDLLKSRGVTAIFCSLEDVADRSLGLEREISSLMDAWVSLTNVEADGEHNRLLFVLKSRGMGHSNQVREYHMSEQGITLIQPYIGPNGVLTGTSRLMQEARERRSEQTRKELVERRKRELEKRRLEVERQIASMRAELDGLQLDEQFLTYDEAEQDVAVSITRQELASARGLTE